ncbi:MAG TPA: outer membrane beta-barrel protein [Ignavibacteria bacterium]
MGKNIFFAVLISLFFINAHSQTRNRFAKEQTWELGGSVGFSSMAEVHNGNSSTALTNISFHPYAGYFFLDGFEVGLIPGIDYYSQGSFDYTTFVIYLEPAYNFNTNSIAYPYIQGGIGYNSISGKSITTVSGFAWDLEAGVKLNLFGNSLLKFSFEYNEKTQNPENYNGKRNGFNTFNFVVGFNVFFQ